MAKIGYARAVTAGQDAEEQVSVLRAAGCERVFVETYSGRSGKSPQLDAALDYLRAGDTFVVTDLSRLSPDLVRLRTISGQLRDHGVDLVALGLAIDPGMSSGQLVYAMLDAIADFGDEMPASGIRSPRASTSAQPRGDGRRSVMTPEKIATAREMHESGEYTIAAIAKAIGVARATVYRYLNDTQEHAGEHARSAAKAAAKADTKVDTKAGAKAGTKAEKSVKSGREPQRKSQRSTKKPGRAGNQPEKPAPRPTVEKRSEPVKEVLSPTSSVIEGRKRYFRP